MHMRRRGWMLVLAVWGAGAAVVVACGDEEPTSPAANTPDGSTPTPTATATATGTTPIITDSAPPPLIVDAGVEAAANALWAFNGYCGDDVDASCQALGKCPGFDGGGIAAQSCSEVFSRCLSNSAPDSGLFDRVFACEAVATPTWELNRICKYEDCTDIDAAACDGFDGGGIAGQACATPRTRCLSGSSRLFLCQPSGGDFFTFNGYCDAGAGTPACNVDFDACAPTDGGTGGSACTMPHERCIVGSTNKLFVCADRE